MTSLHQVVTSVIHAVDYDQAAQALASASGLVQADGAVFCSFNSTDEDYESFRYLVHGAAAFCSMYERSLGFMHDPFLVYAAANTEPIHLSSLRPTNDRQRELLRLAADHGFRDAFAVPVQSGSVRRSCLYFGSAQEAFFSRCDQAALRMTARALAAEMHDWWQKRTAQEFRERHELDAGDVQLLRFEWNGMSSKDIARVLDCSATAVNSRFQRLSDRMGLAGRRQAARMAADAGLFVGAA